mgnify:CR=1 FL=1
MSIFGIRLKELRDESGLTQADIGKLLGKSAAAISKYEIGDRQPTLEDIASLAKHFGTTSDYMLGVSNVKINSENVAGNIAYIMNNLSIDEFISKVHEKTGKLIPREKMESYLNGRAIPKRDELDALAKYAGVEPIFFFKYSDKFISMKYSCPEMEKLDFFRTHSGFKRIINFCIKILENNIDITPFENIVDNMVNLKTKK